MKQNLSLTGNTLAITNIANPTAIDLTKYLDNTDNQQLTYNSSNYTLSLTNGGSSVIGTLIAFRARKTTNETGLIALTDYDLINFNGTDYNDGLGFDSGTGVFTAPIAGIYSFTIGYNAISAGGSRQLKLYLNDSPYEIIDTDIAGGSSLAGSITMKLVAGDKIKVKINTGASNESGTGSFSGFRIY
jgi:hypothetical protein